ncbi:MAG: hypothetical protein ACK5V3_00770 [Bdellovibrionales bacterium]
MNNQNNDSLAFLAIPIAMLAVGALLVKAAISFFNSLGALMTSIATSFFGFAKLIVSIGLIAAAVAIVGGILYAAFYCILKYIRTVRKITAFREEFYKLDSLLRDYVDTETTKAKADVKKLSKDMNALIDELKKPKELPDVVTTSNQALSASINSDPIKEEIMITNNY